MRRLPVLDLALWRSAPANFASQLRHACHHHGFFQLRHRVPSGVVERAVAEAREFFARGAEHKRAIDYSQSPAFRGYMAVGVENTAGRCDHREQLEIAAEGAPPPPAAWPPYTRLRGPNQWPASQPGLRVAIDDYTGHMLRMSAEVTCALCAALRLPSRAVEPYFSPAPHWQLKLAAYPPAPAAAAAGREGGAGERPVGVGAHTDSGWLTALLQDEAGGLQAQPQS
uniref:Non-haem dioxygenase N-terminal domain-containing protein n=1 Tax=Emiliania huxleyi TaxID=2903 RepID=A0A7S3TJX5_EMIHU